MIAALVTAGAGLLAVVALVAYLAHEILLLRDGRVLQRGGNASLVGEAAEHLGRERGGLGTLAGRGGDLDDDRRGGGREGEVAGGDGHRGQEDRRVDQGVELAAGHRSRNAGGWGRDSAARGGR